MQQEKQQADTIIEQVPLVPGFRFYPTEEELVTFYLNNKLEDNRLQELHKVIPVINIYSLEPWQLPSSLTLLFIFSSFLHVFEKNSIFIYRLRHEVSLCRVYAVSGSFRAFDRRPPVEIVTGKETINSQGVFP
ncbi:OLC1v1004653C1 [Oldenlandia corymbosa var. corymbosa]|uniref:OLC1v1004653C1 n=1 Tax=Oldenlandia corymbosa var. corymbosa TaxID=529605 RepID=A0AAV1DFB0_OLDCO|nr:OLC1v1004653C1 [Oldenlandia corymbosa var. corymbosa]